MKVPTIFELLKQPVQAPLIFTIVIFLPIESTRANYSKVRVDYFLAFDVQNMKIEHFFIDNQSMFLGFSSVPWWLGMIFELGRFLFGIQHLNILVQPSVVLVLFGGYQVSLSLNFCLRENSTKKRKHFYWALLKLDHCVTKWTAFDNLEVGLASTDLGLVFPLSCNLKLGFIFWAQFSLKGNLEIGLSSTLLGLFQQ